MLLKLHQVGFARRPESRDLDGIFAILAISEAIFPEKKLTVTVLWMTLLSISTTSARFCVNMFYYNGHYLFNNKQLGNRLDLREDIPLTLY